LCFLPNLIAAAGFERTAALFTAIMQAESASAVGGAVTGETIEDVRVLAHGVTSFLIFQHRKIYCDVDLCFKSLVKSGIAVKTARPQRCVGK
jgi:hypothetical protein